MRENRVPPPNPGGEWVWFFVRCMDVEGRRGSVEEGQEKGQEEGHGIGQQGVEGGRL